MAEVFEASELVESPERFRGMGAILGVLGDPVAHSLSPGFQTAALAACGIAGCYVRVQVEASQLGAVLRALPGAGFAGVNVTIPHKAAALGLVDEADENAQRAGGVNTVLVDGERLLGFNTDGPGLSRAVREEFFVDMRDLRVMVLGAGGGAGRAAAAQCAAERCERLVLANRTVEKASALAAELAPFFRSDRLVGPDERLAVIPLTPEALLHELGRVDLVVNATPLGMKRTDTSPIPAEMLTPNLLVYDMVTLPGGTRLVSDAMAAGARAAGGLSMLLHQGALSFEIWFGRSAPLDAMRRALRAEAGGGA